MIDEADTGGAVADVAQPTGGAPPPSHDQAREAPRLDRDVADADTDDAGDSAETTGKGRGDRAAPDLLAERRTQEAKEEGGDEPWREAGYEAAEIDGHEWTDRDQPLLESWFAHAHEAGVDPDAARAATEWVAIKAAELRAASGIPETPSDYTPPAVKGLEFSEADQPVLESFFAASYEANLSQAQVEVVGRWYSEQLQAQTEARAAADREFKGSAERELQGLWGKEYKAKIQAYGAALEGLGDVGALLSTARAADGSRLINDPRVATWLAELSSNGGTASPQSSRERQIEELSQLRDTDFEKYSKTGGSDKLLALTRALEKSKQPAAPPSKLTPADERRIKAIEKIRDTDINRYWRDGLDAEILKLRRKAGG